MNSLVRYNRGLSRRSFQKSSSSLGLSDNFKKSMENMRQGADQIEETKDLIRIAIDPTKRGQVKFKLARLFQALIPQRLQQFMPEGMSKLLTENLDPLPKISTLFHLNLNTIQDSAAEIIAEARTKKADLVQFRKDIEAADLEKWDPKRLQQFVAGRNKIDIRRELSEVFNEELGLISEEEREAHRQEILASLLVDAQNTEEVIKLLRICASACVRVFNRANLAYHSFENVVRQAAVFRDAVQDMASLNSSMLIAKESILITVDGSVQVLEEVLNSFDEAARHQVASGDTILRLREAQSRIESKVSQLCATIRTKNDQVLDGEFEEVAPLLELSSKN
ncbi:MAG: hypothetical protein A2915_03875 [Candidatus Yanofskybacteria bacterium RIFCSPLOWO2_01_FULL_41_34]|nr:MAG: hypothetical protein A2915_03875 [Candidatus Yanofskybacteria bacterium RIFCSPLOWO2_01_FULL_41_34]